MKYTQEELEFAIKFAVVKAEHEWYMRWLDDAEKIYTSNMPV